MQEVEQIVAILPGSVESDAEVNVAVLGEDLLEARPKLSIAEGGLDELQFAGGGLKVIVHKGGVVPIARGVDADANARHFGIGRLRSGSVLW